MKGRLVRALCAGATAAFAALALPSLASAHETLELTGVTPGGVPTLHIIGDQGGKNDDLITINYNAATDSYIIGHDILGPLPSGCKPLSDGPPYTMVSCQAHFGSQPLQVIQIDSGGGSDTIDVTGGWPETLDQIRISGGDGPKSVSVNGPAVLRASSLQTYVAAQALHIAVTLGDGVDRLTGDNADITASLGNNNDKVTLGNGNNTITMGNGSDKVTLGNGNNTIKMGRGNSKVTLGNGKNRLTKGKGTSTVIVGIGRDIANFLGGNNFFSGGGHDVVKFRGKLRLRCRRHHKTTSFRSSRKEKATC